MRKEKGKVKGGLLLQGLLGAALGLTAAQALADGFDFDDAFIPPTINSSTIRPNGARGNERLDQSHPGRSMIRNIGIAVFALTMSV